MEKIALLFPGQGSQYVGMSKTLCETYEVARRTFEEADDKLGFSLTKLCTEGSLLELSRIENALPALLTASVAAFRVYMQEAGIVPQFLAGHSLGEYSALTCAEAIKFEDAVRLVQLRGQLAKEIADSGIGAMTILSQVDPEAVAEECRKISNEQQIVSISCYNSINEVAVSGHLEAVQLVEDYVIDAGGQVAPLLGTAPFHCSLMQPAADALRDELARMKFAPIKWPVLSNLTGSVYEGADSIARSLTEQIVRPVQWRRTMRNLARYGVTMTVELGAKNVLGNLLKAEVPSIRTLCFDHREDRRELIEELAAAPEYRKHKPTVVTKSLAVAVSTPNRNFDGDSYREGVTEPYRKLQSLQDALDASGAAPTVDQMKESLHLLQKILTSKGVPRDEQADWFYQIFDETGTHYLFPEFGGQVQSTS